MRSKRNANIVMPIAASRTVVTITFLTSDLVMVMIVSGIRVRDVETTGKGTISGTGLAAGVLVESGDITTRAVHETIGTEKDTRIAIDRRRAIMVSTTDEEDTDEIFQ